MKTSLKDVFAVLRKEFFFSSFFSILTFVKVYLTGAGAKANEKYQLGVATSCTAVPVVSIDFKLIQEINLVYFYCSPIFSPLFPNFPLYSSSILYFPCLYISQFQNFFLYFSRIFYSTSYDK